MQVVSQGRSQQNARVEGRTILEEGAAENEVQRPKVRDLAVTWPKKRKSFWLICDWMH